MEETRDLIVFAALFMAFITLQPTLASYEPFAALFALHGTTLQWLLLFIVLTASLLIQTPWCNFFCPMRTIERVVLDTKRWVRTAEERPGSVPVGGAPSDGLSGARRGEEDA
jgi:polyferredoxin